MHVINMSVNQTFCAQNHSMSINNIQNLTIRYLCTLLRTIMTNCNADEIDTKDFFDE